LKELGKLCMTQTFNCLFNVK